MDELRMKNSAPSEGQNNQSLSWPDEWYVCEKGKILGPFTADQAMSKTETCNDGTDRLVSRKGFTQWYPIADFSNLYFLSQKNSQENTKFAEVSKKIIGPQVNLEAESSRPLITLPTSSFTPDSPEQEFLISRLRLRLGYIRNPILNPVITSFFTVFLALIPWYIKADREVNFHLQEKKKSTLWWMSWLTVLPLFSALPLVALCLKMRKMERQNHFLNTSTVAVMFFSIFPPIAALYIQISLNQHWRAHARFEFKRRSNQ